MKKDRNCSMGAYPVYPMYGQMPPQGYMPPMQGMPGVPNNMMNAGTPTTPQNDNYASITNQINNLEKRVSRLENIVSSNQVSPSYSESNFYMV